MITNYFLFTTKGNHYLYSPNNFQFLLLHPLLFYLLKLNRKGIDIENWIQTLNNNNKIENIGIFSKRAVLYQYKKMQFLLANICTNSKEIKLYKYSAAEIEKFIANTRGITFEVTENCNLVCDYCIYGKYYIDQRTTKNKILNFDIAKNVLDYFLPIWKSSLNSSYNNKITIGFYGGEALLNFNLIEKIVHYLKSLEIYKINRIEFSMTTNGVLLDKYIDFLVENNFTIKVSLDGGTEKENSYRKFHNGEIAFNKIYENIQKIKNKYPLYFEKHIDFISILHNNNIESNVVDFFSKTFNKRVLISSLATDGLNPALENEFWKMNKISSTKEENDVMRRNQKENNLELYDIIKFYFNRFVFCRS